MASSKYRKGDLVIVDNDGNAQEVEIVSMPVSSRGRKVSGELCYEARNISTGERVTISEDQILRLATPVDNSAELFSKPKGTNVE